MRVKSKIIIIAVIVGLGLLGAGYAYYKKAAIAEKPLPILDFADQYASAVSKYNFDKAGSMGTEGNRRSLATNVKPAFDQLAKQTSVAKLTFNNVEFEKSLMYENIDHMDVIEKLTLVKPARDIQALYLRFEVKKNHKGYLVQHSVVEDFPVY